MYIFYLFIQESFYVFQNLNIKKEHEVDLITFPFFIQKTTSQSSNSSSKFLILLQNLKLSQDFVNLSELNIS